MSRILKWVLGYTTIIGTVLIAFYFVYGGDVVFIQKHQIANTNMYLWEFKIYDYFKNIQESLKLYLLVIPEMPAVPNTDWTDGFKAIAYWVMYGLNIVIWVINLYIIMPIRMIFYIIMVILSIFGLRSNILVENLTILFKFSIPYIDYSLI